MPDVSRDRAPAIGGGIAAHEERVRFIIDYYRNPGTTPSRPETVSKCFTEVESLNDPCFVQIAQPVHYIGL